jgi:hypothetical protein
LAQLADVATQQQYLNGELNLIDGLMITAPIIEAEEPIDVSEVVEEDGEVLENVDDNHGRPRRGRFSMDSRSS